MSGVDHIRALTRQYSCRCFPSRSGVVGNLNNQGYGIYEASDLEAANQALERFADLYDSGQIPEYHDVVDKIIAWGQEILGLPPRQTSIQRTTRGDQQPAPKSYDASLTGSPTTKTTQPEGTS